MESLEGTQPMNTPIKTLERMAAECEMKANEYPMYEAAHVVNGDMAARYHEAIELAHRENAALPSAAVVIEEINAKADSHFFIHLCVALALSGFLWFLLIHAAISIGRVLSKVIP